MANLFDLSDLNTVGLMSHLNWLRNLPIQIDQDANYGCWSSEPFAIKSITSARRVFVIEIDRTNLTSSWGLSPIEEYELLQRKYSSKFSPSSIIFIQGDIRKAPLLSGRVDLSYCEDVLYNIADDQRDLLEAINEIARVVRKNGIVVAVEQKLGVEFENVGAFLGELPVPRNEPLDISELFHSVGLEKCQIANEPDYSYCYIKR